MDNKEKTIEEMPLDVAMKLAKDEYINKFNEVTSRYKLPAFLLEIILGQMYTEVKTIAENDLSQGLKKIKKGE